MLKTLLAALMALSVNASATRDETYNSTYASCLLFAAKFDNTCTDLENAVAWADVPTATVECTSTDSRMGCPASGTLSNSDTTCTFPRMLCLTCRTDDDGVVWIRSQSNSMPSHCLLEGESVLSVETDFDTQWLREGPDYTAEDWDCDIFLASNNAAVPNNDIAFDNTGALPINPGWGVSVTGATIGRVEDDLDNFARFDTCSAHENADGRYHYHFPTACIANATIASEMKDEDSTIANAEEDIIPDMKEQFKILPYRSVFGLAKDGRPIYTPYYDNLKNYKSCDVDMCNGMMIGDHYAYVTTFFYPYYTACYGTGAVEPQDTHFCLADLDEELERTCDGSEQNSGFNPFQGLFEDNNSSTQLTFVATILIMFSSIYMI